MARSTQNVLPSFFVFSAYGRKSKPPALQVVVDSVDPADKILLPADQAVS